MCGIIGYIGEKQSYPILIKGLRRLEYRGYDSSGVALLDTTLSVFKKKGKIADLESFVSSKKSKGQVGIGHTRWATHGVPNDINAHPHLSNSKKIAIVHNGIIENYVALKKGLEKKGHTFRSQTDSEVLAHLIEEIMIHTKNDLLESVRLALCEVVGAYAVAVVSEDYPDQIIVAKKSSPLVIGVGEKEFYIASDATPIVEYTRKVIYLADGEIAQLSRSGEMKVLTIADNKKKNPFIHSLELELESIEKGGFDHFMLKEIFEQPRSITDTFRGRISEDGKIVLGGLDQFLKKIINARRFIFIACGTSWHAGLVGEHFIEDLVRIPAEVEYASEFRYRNPVISEDDVVVAISQSGETADTLAAVELAKSKGATVLGVCNVVGSSIARTVHAGCYTHAGPEIGVASTKAFTAQISSLLLLALFVAEHKKTFPKNKIKEILAELQKIPNKIEKILKNSEKIKNLAALYKNSKNAIYLGRGYAFPVALEGALKLKEISYIHAEGYPSAEMKHGPIALVDKNMPVVCLATRDLSYDKILSNMQEVKAREGNIIGIVTAGDTEVKKIARHTIEIPETLEMLMPLLAVIPLQLFAYHCAILRGCNVDQPRNLAKSVTVE